MSIELTDRKKAILDLLTKNSSTSVAEMSQALGVSAVTIRTDLSQLEEGGVLVRTRGGALPAFHPAILERQRSNKDQKIAMAKLAVSLVEDGDTIMIGAGTTTALIAKFLLGRRDIHIVTNNTLLLPYVRVNPAIRTTLVGGEFRASEEGVIGPVALRALEQFYVSKAFIGVDGISLKQGLTGRYVETAELVRKMAEQAEKVIVLTGSSKIGTPGFARIAGLEEVHTLISDDGLDAAFREALQEARVNLMTI